MTPRELIKTLCEQIREEEMRNIAHSEQWEVKGNSLVLPEGSADREYNQGAFVSQTLAKHGIKPR